MIHLTLAAGDVFEAGKTPVAIRWARGGRCAVLVSSNPETETAEVLREFLRRERREKASETGGERPD